MAGSGASSSAGWCVARGAPEPLVASGLDRVPHHRPPAHRACWSGPGTPGPRPMGRAAPGAGGGVIQGARHRPASQRASGSIDAHRDGVEVVHAHLDVLVIVTSYVGGGVVGAGAAGGGRRRRAVKAPMARCRGPVRPSTVHGTPATTCSSTLSRRPGPACGELDAGRHRRGVQRFLGYSAAAYRRRAVSMRSMWASAHLRSCW